MDCFMRDWRFIYLSAQFFCCSQGFHAHALLGRLVYFSMSYINISGIYIAPTALLPPRSCQEVSVRLYFL